MLRVIREFSPKWVIGENVGGFVTWSDGLVLRQVFTDLEGEGYEIQAFVIPAVGVNAPHKRDRIWIVANRKGERLQGFGEQSQRAESELTEHSRNSWERPWIEVATELCRVDDGLPHRVDRIKALGNAIVPQVAQEIMQAIKDTNG